MPYLTAILFSCFVSFLVNSQILPFEWVTAYGADDLYSASQTRACVIGSNDVLYSAGNFNGSVDFQPDAGGLYLNAAGSDMFIQKQDSDGTILWLKQIGTANGSVLPSDIVLDLNGNIVITGTFTKSVDFDPGPNQAILNGGGAYADGFILKLNANGDYLWSYMIDSQQTIRCNDIAVLSNNDVVVTGEFFLTTNFDPGQSDFSFTSSGHSDCFVARIDESGSFVWAKQFGGQDVDRSFAIGVNHLNEIAVGGDFFYTVDFDPGSNVYNLTAGTSLNDRDGFLLKLDEAGNFIWANQIGGANLTSAGVSSVIFDNTGDIVFCGSYGGEVDFDPSPNVFNMEYSQSVLNSGFIVKLNSAGNFIFAKSLNCDYLVELTELEVDQHNDLYLSGHFMESIDIDPTIGSEVLLSNGGFKSMFLLKYDSGGNLTSYDHFQGDANACLLLDFSISNSAETLYASGSYQETVDFDSSVDEYEVTRDGNALGFVVKLHTENETTENEPIENTQPGGISMPNVLTANTDGINDVFIPVELHDNVEIKEIVIINRWGNVIYFSSSFDNPWDGTSKNKLCAEGTYFWLLNYELDGMSDTMHGTVNLLK